MRRARDAALEAGRHNGLDLAAGDVSFPGGDWAPVRVKVEAKRKLPTGGGEVPADATATAELAPPAGDPLPLEASGAGYSGPLAYRQGKPMRPDVARAFDRMEAAARADGVQLIVTSGYRSDAEQAELYERHPDPKWVAPPGKSLHRCGTELDLGPPAAYGWLARNARALPLRQALRLGAVALRLHAQPAFDARAPTRRRAPGDGRSAVPSFVPAAYAAPIARAAQPLERVRRAARRPALRRERLQPVRGQPGGRARHRAVHAGHRAHLRPARPVRPARPRSRPRPT